MLLVETGSERAEDSMLEAEVITLGLIGCIAALKLLKVDRKVDRLIAQSCRNSRGLIEADLLERALDLEVLLSLDKPLLIDGGLKFVEVI